MKLKICRIVVSHDDGTKLELSSARCRLSMFRALVRERLFLARPENLRTIVGSVVQLADI